MQVQPPGAAVDELADDPHVGAANPPSAGLGLAAPIDERTRLLHQMISEALDRCDFQALVRLLGVLGLRKAEVRNARRLARAGDLLLRLDLEDLDCPHGLEEPLRSGLLAVALPQAPTATPKGLLASLLPTAALLLDVISVRHRQGQVEALLAAVHLLSEILPLLAWEEVLGHSGDPTQLLKVVSQPDCRWGTDNCPSRGPGRRAASTLSTALRSPDLWQRYLQRCLSLLGTQLEDCASCRLSCRMSRLAGGGEGAIAIRLRTAAALRRSDLLGERHGSAVGHAFAVPTMQEVDAAWRRTRRQLIVLVPAAARVDDHPFPGLREVIAAIAGGILPVQSVLNDVLSELARELRVVKAIEIRMDS